MLSLSFPVGVAYEAPSHTTEPEEDVHAGWLSSAVTDK